MAAIEIKKLFKTYATGTEALKGVDLVVEEGDFFGLLGANGAGKTTIIGILSSLVTKTSGEASLFGFDVAKQGDEAKTRIGVVPQEFNFSIFEKVWDIVITQAGYYGLTEKEAAPHAEEILKRLDLWEKRHQVSRSLSGGMKRRLLIARALVHKPKLLILDEPTAGVDVELRRGMWEYLTELNQQGTTILLTTHYLEEAERLCKNVAIIAKGSIIKQGKVSELLADADVRSYILTLDTTKNLETPENVTMKITGDTTVEIDLRKNQDLGTLIASLKEKGFVVRDIRTQENRLERLFLDTIKK